MILAGLLLLQDPRWSTIENGGIRAGDAPPDGAWTLALDQEDPQRIGPEGFWRASDVPVLYLGAAITTSHREGRLYWST